MSLVILKGKACHRPLMSWSLWAWSCLLRLFIQHGSWMEKTSRAACYTTLPMNSLQFPINRNFWRFRICPRIRCANKSEPIPSHAHIRAASS